MSASAVTIDLNDPAVRERLARAWIGPPADGEPFWWERYDPAEEVVTRERTRIVEALLRVERIHGPPTAMEMLSRKEFEAERDPLMPPWLHRYWFIPSEAMLAMDALFEETFGVGYSAAGGGFEGRRAITSSDLWTTFTLLIVPTPGTVGTRERREALEAEMPARLAAIGIPGVRVTIWNETEPAKAFQGMYSGMAVREGYKRLGIPREYSQPVDIDSF